MILSRSGVDPCRSPWASGCQRCKPGIDDVKTKAELLSFCHAQNWPVVSALGSGAKDDASQLCVTEALRDIDNDPLATKLRKMLGSRLDFEQTSFVYSCQKVQRSLLPLTEEQRSCPEAYGTVEQFRLRVIPVLGSQPAAAGMAMASEVLNRLRRSYWARPTEAPRRSLVEKLLESFKRNELKRRIQCHICSRVPCSPPLHGMVPLDPGPRHNVPELGYARLLAFHICLLFLH